MLKQLIFSTQELLSVEIGTEFVKLLHFKRTGRGGKIINLIAKDIRSLADEDIAGFIKDYLDQHHLKIDIAVNSIPPRASINKNIELPSTDPKEIKEIVNLQAGRYTPYSREEIEINYIPIGTYTSGYTKIMLVIVNKDIIKRNQDILERAGLRLKKTVLVSEALAQWYQGISPTPEVPTCLLHFDYGTVDFIVVTAGKPVFVRSILIGTNQLLTDSERFREKFMDELRSSVEAYHTEKMPDFERVVLLGAVDKLSDLVPPLEKVLGKSVTRESYFDHLTLAPQAVESRKTFGQDISFLPEISAAQRYRKVTVDLTPEEIRLREAMTEKRRAIIYAGTQVMFILIVLAILVAVKISRARSYLEYLKNIYNKTHREAEELKRCKKETILIHEHLASRAFIIEALTAFYERIPKEIYLETLTFVAADETQVEKEKIGGKLIARGILEEENREVYFQFTKTLEQTPYFKKVDTPSISTHIKDGKNYHEFELVCIIPLTALETSRQKE